MHNAGRSASRRSRLVSRCGCCLFFCVWDCLFSGVGACPFVPVSPCVGPCACVVIAMRLYVSIGMYIFSLCISLCTHEYLNYYSSCVSYYLRLSSFYTCLSAFLSNLSHGESIAHESFEHNWPIHNNIFVTSQMFIILEHFKKEKSIVITKTDEGKGGNSNPE